MRLLRSADDPIGSFSRVYRQGRSSQDPRESKIVSLQDAAIACAKRSRGVRTVPVDTDRPIVSSMEGLEESAKQLRASGVLGKPGPLLRLFDYLLERSLAGDAPREIEIALDVFGKPHGFDVSQDAVVRVYVHKLRRRLDEYYSRCSPLAERIVVPKGEYRLVMQRHEPVAVHENPPQASQARPKVVARPWHRRTVLIVALLGAVALGAAIAAVLLMTPRDVELRAVRESPIWAPLFEDELPITIVLGDSVPASLPGAAALALHDIMPLLSMKKDVRMMLMSELKGGMLKDTHIVYVGYLSGMGVLRGPVFNASRLVPGESPDVLIDSADNEQYRSSAGARAEARYVDYGYFATFPGPKRNRVVVIAGTGDTGLRTVAEMLSRPAEPAALTRKLGAAPALESLYEIYGVAQVGVHAKQVFAAPLVAARIWE
jgi:hypothetical protein